MLDELRNAVQEANALYFVTLLRADDAGARRPDDTTEPSIVAPATYAAIPGVPNSGGPRVNRVRTHDRAEARTVLSSTGAEAHRHKLALRDALAEDPALPFPRVHVEGAVDLKGKGRRPWALDILDLPHGGSDTYLRWTSEWSEFDPFVMGFGQLDLRDDATRIYQRCIHMLLVGGWASYYRAAARIPRTLSSSIEGITILPNDTADDPLVTYKTQRSDPLIKGTIGLPEGMKPKKKDKDKLSAEGLGDIPGKHPTSKVLIDYAVAKTTISFAGLRQIRFAENGGRSHERDLAGRTVAAALGLLMHELVQRHGYYLRSGCSLVPILGKTSRVLVGADGRESALPWDQDARPRLTIARELYVAAVQAAEGTGLQFDPARTLHADRNLNDAVSHSTRFERVDEDEGVA
ncbi:hypothetical protein EPN52_14880 [bacterium]|nr:MAG: hypothetical protein EPN52_14880 [bacterium]